MGKVAQLQAATDEVYCSSVTVIHTGQIYFCPVYYFCLITHEIIN